MYARAHVNVYVYICVFCLKIYYQKDLFKDGQVCCKILPAIFYHPAHFFLVELKKSITKCYKKCATHA